MQSWKNRLNGGRKLTNLKEAPKELETLEIIEQKLNQLLWQIGQHKLHEEVIKAESIQWCQEALRLKTRVAELKAPVKEAPVAEVLPADPITPKIS